MKTRTLLLLALGCAVAILLAGAAFFVQLAAQGDAPPPLAVGESDQVGDMSVRVRAADEVDDELSVVVELAGAADDDPATGFRLSAPGTLAPPTASDCSATDGSPQTCTLRFDVSGLRGSARELVFERGDDRARWRLA